MNIRTNPLLLNLFILLALITSCKNQDKSEAGTESAAEEANVGNVVEVVTKGMDFNLIKEIPSGWTTFKYVNNSFEPHFFVLEKMPDTLGLATYKKELFPPFIAAFEHFQKGDFDAGMKEFEKIPPWFAEVELSGGVGMTSPKSTSQSTFYLDPGTYVMECYVRMPNGMAHTFMGMIAELTVTEDKNDAQPPAADHAITVSSESGISFADTMKEGEYVFSVKFEDQQQYEHMMGHDVNLVMMENDTLLNSLNSWINASDLMALRSPSPEGLTFLGGVEDLPAESTGYFKATLKSGRYVLISEIPQAVERNMYKTFTVF